jgi:hypothetical protein
MFGAALVVFIILCVIFFVFGAMGRKGKYFRERAASGKSGRAEDAPLRAQLRARGS